MDAILRDTYGVMLYEDDVMLVAAALAGGNRHRGFPGGSAYCASKFGLAGLSEVLLYEARTSNVRVTCVFPSTVSTDLVKKSGLTFEPARAIQPEDVAKAVVSLVATDDRALTKSLEIWQTNP